MATFTLPHGSRRANHSEPRSTNALVIAIDTALDVLTVAQWDSTDFVQDTLLGIAATAARAGYRGEVANALSDTLLWACAYEQTVPTSGLVDRLLDVRTAVEHESVMALA